MIDLPTGTRLVLASASPRRSDLLRQIGLEFEIRPADIDESVHEGEDPDAYVRRLSIDKAEAVARRAGSEPGRNDVVIAADTTVEIGGHLLGKPLDVTDARRMLQMLVGATHRVHTGVTIRDDDRTVTMVVVTEVTFVAADDDMIDWYIGTGEPFGKAGGYAMQGAGGVLVARVDGSVSNVIGLPLAETAAMIRSVLR